MNIHPQYSGAPWFKSPAEVIEELDEIGCTVARIDCYGLEDDARLVLEHARAAAAKGILVVPCFAYNQPFAESNYESGVYCGKLPAGILRDHCPIYEVTNEISVYCNGVGPGTDPARYDPARYVECRELIRGLIDGIREAQPDARIIIGGGITTLTAFNAMLWHGTEPNGSSGHPVVRWDYTGWHWYTSSGRIDAAYDGTGTPYNVIEALAAFGVPIWITELGFVPDNSDFERQSAYVSAALAEYHEHRQAYGVIGACWYALYDDGSGDFGLSRAEDDAASAAAPSKTEAKAYDARAYARKKSKKAERASLKSRRDAPAPEPSYAGTDALLHKPAHETYKLFVAMNPDEGDGGGDGGDHRAEYRLPMAVYRSLVAAAERHGVSENDELVRRLASTFLPPWSVYEKLTAAAQQNGVPVGEGLLARLESTFS
ncbi:hypothetical protein [Burkholderia gladioli]|uniref:hypothetical protein n=1 Tax=Burkholderia gladioli TaxID=28095 RepID=UPI000CFF8F65|nr:hypothetical protein [Burkholderia gladioli]PRE90316.1 hypothetical protein C6Q13_05720 [Burkholderia gladioli]